MLKSIYNFIQFVSFTIRHMENQGNRHRKGKLKDKIKMVGHKIEGAEGWKEGQKNMH